VNATPAIASATNVTTEGRRESRGIAVISLNTARRSMNGKNEDDAEDQSEGEGERQQQQQ